MDNILRRVNEELGSVGTPYEVTQVVPIRLALSDNYFLGVGALSDGKLRAGLLVDSKKDQAVKLNCTAVANQVWTSTKDIHGWATISANIGLIDYFEYDQVSLIKIPLSTASMQYINEQATQLVNQRFWMANVPVGHDAVTVWLLANTSHNPVSIFGLVGNSLSDGVLAGFKEESDGGAVFYYIQNTDGQGYKRYLYLQCSVDGLYGYVEDARWTTIMPEGGSNWQALEVTDQQFNELRAAYNMIGNRAINLKYEHS